MSGLNDDTLQRLYDGDLDEDQVDKAREAVAENADDAKRLESLAQMRQLIRANAEAAADAADFAGLWPAVAAGIRQDDPTETAKALGAAPGVVARFKAWLGLSMGAHPVRWATAGLCAVAAAVVLGVVISLSVTPKAPPIERPSARSPASDELDIEKMEFKGRHPDIFQIKDGKRTTTVIWVYPEEEDDDDPGADNGDDPGTTDPI